MDITLVDVTDVTAAAPGDAVVLFGAAPISDDGRGGRDGAYADTLAAAVGGVVGEADEAPRRMSHRLGPPTVEEVAAWAETIPHEILSRVASRVPRRYLDSAASGGALR